MKLNVKLFPSALGLVIGLWMLACGGPSYDVINTEKPGHSGPVSKKTGVKTPVKKKQAEVRLKSVRLAMNSLFAFDQKRNEEICNEWPIESFK